MMSVAKKIRPFQELKLHRGQMTVLSHHARFKVVVAGRRWGKTQTAKASIIRRAKKPRQLIWYVAPTYRMARGIMWYELLDAIPRKWILGKPNETLMTIRLINGTRIELKGADKPDTLRGVGLNHLVIDEAQDIKEETWVKVLRPTLASTIGDSLIIGTPKSFNWLYEHYMLGQRGETYVDEKGNTRPNDWMSWQFPTITSPFIPESEIEAARRDMDEKSFRQEFEASFETMSGRVYYPFDRSIHLKDLKYDPKLPLWVGQDFNIDPMSSIIMQLQKDGRTIHVIDEIILMGSNTQETCEELSRRYWRGLKSLTVYPDPAGQNRSHARGESDLDIFREAGFKRLKYRRKHPKISDRVNAVNRLLRAADGTVRLYINRNCKHLISALEQTIYKKGSREVDKSMGVEHPADALGYCVEIEFPVRDIVIMGVSI
jgi:hypothetical protein